MIWRAISLIDFLGRIDQQVKIHGMRIELGEIEAVLNQYPAVRDAAVIIHEDKNSLAGSDKRLVAYCVVETEAQTEGGAEVGTDVASLTATWRRFLQERTSGTDAYVAPCTPVEATLAVIWAETLELEQISVHDNFFDLGGHSLLAVQVLSRTRAAFSIEMPIRRLFESPTVAEFAACIEEIKTIQEIQTYSDAVAPTRKRITL